MSRHVHTLAIALLLGGCYRGLGAGGDDGGGGADGGSQGSDAGPNPDSCGSGVGNHEDNDIIRLGLESSCKGCHAEGAKGYFASLAAFEGLLVANPRLVVPGSPESSELIAVLEGRGAGSSPQMPLGAMSFAQLDDAGLTDISLEEIEGWISNLDAVTGAPSRPDRDAITVRRLDAAHVELALRDLLGLTRDDFFKDAESYGIPVDELRDRASFPVHNPDAIPGAFSSVPVLNYYALGGGSPPGGVNVERTVGAPFVQTMVPLSQQWCRMAVAKPDNASLFKYATATSSSAADSAAIVDNIVWLHARFHGTVIDRAEGQRILEEVFIPLEAANDDPSLGWTGVCSYLIRHPQFIVY